ncbi:MAG: hypothetical protein AUJ49_03385 [Desulfovibrionaceae bacterium CG1_02_65_16]|nr:MAG: hypothetical protein AUJ49_03385 [Desulfovibrionaceae bacterium CG1_02_65_16]
MTQAYLLWAALVALAALAGLGAAWWGRGRFVHGRRAMLAVGVFLAVGLAGGYLAHGPVAELLAGRRLAAATHRADEIFHTDGLLRAFAQAEPERAAALHARLALALAAATDAEAAPVEERLRAQALREALAAAFARLPNASDEAAARLAQALLNALTALQSTDALLCLGLLHPSSQTDTALTDNALARLEGSTRKDLENALALTLASSVIRPHAAPPPVKTDAALADMFAENLTDFQQTYGKPKAVAALFEALAEPDKSRAVPPEVLCAFAQDLLRALLRMPPAERGPGLRRLLGAG